MDDDAELRERFAEEIPVVLVDGVQRDFWKIDEARLERTLRRALGRQAKRRGAAQRALALFTERRGL